MDSRASKEATSGSGPGNKPGDAMDAERGLSGVQEATLEAGEGCPDMAGGVGGCRSWDWPREEALMRVAAPARARVNAGGNRAASLGWAGDSCGGCVGSSRGVWACVWLGVPLPLARCNAPAVLAKSPPKLGRLLDPELPRELDVAVL